MERAPLQEPALADTAVWTWVRDRRFPELAKWFNEEVRAGRILVCDLIVIELLRLTPNERRARESEERFSAFPSLPMPEDLWRRARAVQLALAPAGDHRRVPPADLLIAAAAAANDTLLLHYDADYEAIAQVSNLRHEWLVPRGTFAESNEAENPSPPPH